MSFMFADIILRRDPINKQNREVTERIEDYKAQLLFIGSAKIKNNDNKIATQNIINKLAEELSWHFAFILKKLFKRGEVIYRYETNSCWFMDTDEIVYNIATFERLLSNEKFKVIDLQTGYEEDPELMDSIVFPIMFDSIGPYLVAMDEYKKEIINILKYELRVSTLDTDRYDDIINMLARFKVVFEDNKVGSLHIFSVYLGTMFCYLLLEVAGFGDIAYNIYNLETYWIDPANDLAINANTIRILK